MPMMMKTELRTYYINVYAVEKVYSCHFGMKFFLERNR